MREGGAGVRAIGDPRRKAYPPSRIRGDPMLQIVAPLIAVLALFAPSMASAVSCNSFTTSGSCEAVAQCGWTGSSCVCDSGEALDVAFLLYRGGGVGTGSWNDVKNFTGDLISTAMPSTARTALIPFATESSIEYTWADSQAEQDVLSALNALLLLGGATATRDAIQDAIDVWDASGDQDRRSVVFLLTNDDPFPISTQNPCSLKSALDARGMSVFLFGIGNQWSEAAQGCLVDDPGTDILQVQSYTPSVLDATRDVTDALLCQEQVPEPSRRLASATALARAAGSTQARPEARLITPAIADPPTRESQDPRCPRIPAHPAASPPSRLASERVARRNDDSRKNANPPAPVAGCAGVALLLCHADGGQGRSRRPAGALRGHRCAGARRRRAGRAVRPGGRRWRAARPLVARDRGVGRAPRDARTTRKSRRARRSGW